MDFSFQNCLLQPHIGSRLPLLTPADPMVDKWFWSFYEIISLKGKLKVVSYLSSEFLLGPHLVNNPVNLV